MDRADPVRAGPVRPREEHARADPAGDVDRRHLRDAADGSGDRPPRQRALDAPRRDRALPRRAAAAARARAVAAADRAAGARRGERDDGRVDERPRRVARGGSRAADHVLAARGVELRRLRRRGRGGRRDGAGRRPARAERRRGRGAARRAAGAPGAARPGLGRRRRERPPLAAAPRAAARVPVLPDHAHRGRDGRLERRVPARRPRGRRRAGRARVRRVRRRHDRRAADRRRDQPPDRRHAAAPRRLGARRDRDRDPAAGRAAGRRARRALPGRRRASPTACRCCSARPARAASRSRGPGSRPSARWARSASSIGPPFIGFLAEWTSLPLALATLCLATGAVTLLATRACTRPRAAPEPAFG